MTKRGRYVMAVCLVALIVFLALTSPNNEKSIEALSEEIIGSGGIGELELKGQSELKRYYGIGRDDVEGFVLYGPVNSADVSEFLLVKVKDKDEMDRVRKAVEGRKYERLQTFSGAGGTQTQLLNDARLKVRGDFLFYCVGENADMYADSFVKYVNK